MDTILRIHKTKYHIQRSPPTFTLCLVHRQLISDNKDHIVVTLSYDMFQTKGLKVTNSKCHRRSRYGIDKVGWGMRGVASDIWHEKPITVDIMHFKDLKCICMKKKCMCFNIWSMETKILLSTNKKTYGNISHYTI